ncbi:MAG: hypothetical protein OEV93_02010 [Candidatus Moranbacteria bacterium]|nr:hypothetical protein [Candidatus Moranbacteria bacterium]
MRLKFLFFPFALVVATILSIWFIWPTWFDAEEGIVAIRKDIEKQEEELANVQSRKNNLLSLKNNIDSEVSNSALTKKYYPDQKDTEKIINEINNFASGTGVAVVDMDVNVMDRSDRRVRGGEARFACLPVDATTSATTAVQAGAATVKPIEEGQVVVTTMDVNVIGGYEEIRNFITRLQGIELINNVHSISLAKDETENVEGGAKTPSVNQLNAKIGVCFGYLSPSKIDKTGDFISHESFSKSAFNFEYINGINAAVYRAAAQIEIGQSGKNNPFLP